MQLHKTKKCSKNVVKLFNNYNLLTIYRLRLGEYSPIITSTSVNIIVNYVIDYLERLKTPNFKYL